MELPYFAYAWLHHGEGNVAFHCHGGCEILLVTRGKCRVESSSGILEGVPGTLIVIPPGVRHNQINEPGERNLFCVFQASPDFFPSGGAGLMFPGSDGFAVPFLNCGE